MQQRQPIILLPLRLICHDEFTFCKDKDYHRQYKVKHKINRGFFASFFPYCLHFVRAWFKSPSDGQAADRSTNFFSRVHGSSLPRPCLLCFFSLLSIPSRRNLPTLCCSTRLPHFLFSFILVGEEGAKVGGESGQRLTTWTAVEEENDSVGQATDKLLGRKVGVVVMRWC